MKSKFQTKLSDQQFKMMRSSMLMKDEAGFLGLKFVFSLAVFLVLLPVFPLALIWFIVCTALALNERSNRASIRAARIIGDSQYRAQEHATRRQVTQRRKKPCDYYYD